MGWGSAKGGKMLEHTCMSHYAVSAGGGEGTT